MSTSEYGGIIEYDPSDLAANEPVDTALVRRVINNANHRADQAGQVVCNWVAIDPTLGGAPLELVHRSDWTGYLPDADVWYRFPIRPVWDAKVRPDGSGCRLRIRLSGSYIVGTTSPSADFAVVVGPYGTGREDVHGAGSVTKTVTGVTGTAAQALIFDDGTTWIDVPSSVIAGGHSAGGLQRTHYDIGGAETTVTSARMMIMVCARPGTDGARPRLHSFYAAEY